MHILGERSPSTKDTSLKVKNGHNGTITYVEILSREKGDVLEEGIEKIVKVSIAQKRKIKVGDKMVGGVMEIKVLFLLCFLKKISISWRWNTTWYYA
ncbi:hypothetical protein NWP96_04330 [Mycoplasmopsis cynos]|nr:hypothetical protein [Mycoplasmopsis cynos]